MTNSLIIKRVLAYFKTKPSWASIRFFALTFPIWAITTFLFLRFSGFFALATYEYTTQHLLLWLAIYMVMPSILEESIYRPIFFPLDIKLRSKSFVLRMLLSTAIFVIVHPITAYFFMPDDFPVFSDWRFLTAVTILGFYCSVLLVHTKSIYFGILTHYVMVIGWKFVFCGHHVPTG